MSKTNFLKKERRKCKTGFRYEISEWTTLREICSLKSLKQFIINICFVGHRARDPSVYII